MDFVIDDEIRDLLPVASPETLAKLRQKLQSEGCRDCLVVGVLGGDRLLIDGHTRKALCDEMELVYRTREIVFTSREAVIEWVVENQLGRRNLTDKERAYFIGKQYLIRKQAHGSQERLMSSPSGHCAHLGEKAGKTAETVAAEQGVDEKTVRRNAEFAAAVAFTAAATGQTVATVLKGPETKKDTVEAVKKPRKPKKPKNGREKFDWKGFDSPFGKVVRSLDGVANAYDGEKKSREYVESRKLLTSFHSVWESWKKRLTKV